MTSMESKWITYVRKNVLQAAVTETEQMKRVRKAKLRDISRALGIIKRFTV